MREVVQSRTDDADAVIAATKEPSPTEEAAMGTQAGDLQPLVSDLTPGELVNQLSMLYSHLNPLFVRIADARWRE